MIVRFDRVDAGLRNAFAVFSRMPRRWLTSKYAQPSLSPPLKSSTFRMPVSLAASRNASRISQDSRWRSTRHSPPLP
jgi:hypothetical protein